MGGSIAWGAGSRRLSTPAALGQGRRKWHLPGRTGRCCRVTCPAGSTNSLIGGAGWWSGGGAVPGSSHLPPPLRRGRLAVPRPAAGEGPHIPRDTPPPPSPLFPTAALPPHPAAPPIQTRLTPCGGAATLLASRLDRGQVLSPLSRSCAGSSYQWPGPCPPVRHPCTGHAHERLSRGHPFPAQAVRTQSRAVHAYRHLANWFLWIFDRSWMETTSGNSRFGRLSTVLRVCFSCVSSEHTCAAPVGGQGDASAWERQVYTFAQHRQLPLLGPFVPTAAPQLRRQVGGAAHRCLSLTGSANGCP